jgi:NhaP-type Na+/H+ or K+/H+ antiporter
MAGQNKAEPKALEEIVLTRVLHLNATIQGIVAGLVLGLAIFVATNWLILRGGDRIGPHLSLLGQFFIGYGVTFTGSLIGFMYGFGSGFIGGYMVATIYNWLVRRREQSRSRLHHEPAKSPVH